MNCHLLCPICVAQASLPGGPVARQALVGSAWHAPLTLLVQSAVPFAPLLGAFIPAIFAGIAVFRFIHRLTVGSTERRAAGSSDRLIVESSNEYLLFVICYLFSIVCAVSAAAAAALSSSPTAAALFIYSFLKLADWALRRRLRDWVLLSCSLGALVLCGLPYIGWIVGVVALLPLLIAADKRLRPRTVGLMFLCLAPVVYAAGCWLLLSHLIFSDPVFAWRFAATLKIGTFPDAALWTAAACAAAAVASAAIGSRKSEVGSRKSKVESRKSEVGGRKSPSHLLSVIRYPLSVICAAAAAAALWFGALSSCGLAWALPWGAPANLPPPDLDAVAKHVKDATPWGRVFVCGYAGLGARASNPNDAAIFEPCLDPHLGALREAYTRQRLFILVPRPDRENALEPPEWRYGGLYGNGAQRLLLDEDFGPWRLYEVVSAEF